MFEICWKRKGYCVGGIGYFWKMKKKERDYMMIFFFFCLHFSAFAFRIRVFEKRRKKKEEFNDGK